ncbi:hypothetical protein G9U51_11395 [Calidifontibacter sp. DB0510]|uniref:Uncharacterized protein n=1 Tax=Metallococcus carri TaxID=1656884 RepID=A0A967B6B2_9MICO|nr:hypothetical protein [Metallococcus carri]NHN56382.1 hypothetical protein [Metallococcus carri]NOP36006.1 hypothetical protein [Calidifontibacter sp. DB2511S]
MVLLILGIILGVVGVILLTGAVALPASIANSIAPNTLGWILLVAGIIALVAGLLAMRRRRTTVVDRTVDRPVDRY